MRIGPKGLSGYHQVFTVLVPVDVHDEIEFSLGVDLKPRAEGELRVECAVAPGEDNLAARALRALEREAQCSFRGRVVIRKGIPSGAGLGGGSSDGALALAVGAQLITEAGGPQLGGKALRRLALSLGADVPFFLDPRPSIGRGIGEILESLALPLLWFVLVFGDRPLYAREVYQLFDELTSTSQLADFGHRVEQAEEQWKRVSDPGGAAALLHNDLETAAFARIPSLRDLRELIVREGALGALMSGSGSTLFGLCASEDEAVELSRRLCAWGLRAKVTRALTGFVNQEV